MTPGIGCTRKNPKFKQDVIIPADLIKSTTGLLSCHKQTVCLSVLHSKRGFLTVCVVESPAAHARDNIQIEMECWCSNPSPHAGRAVERVGDRDENWLTSAAQVVLVDLNHKLPIDISEHTAVYPVRHEPVKAERERERDRETERQRERDLPGYLILRTAHTRSQSQTVTQFVMI